MSATASMLHLDPRPPEPTPLHGGSALDTNSSPEMVPRRVLVVDDNRDASSSLAALLRMMGHVVAVADDGPSALALVAAGQSFDVAVLDIGLPGMSGHALASQLRQRYTPPTLRLVALTGHALGPRTAVPRASGFDDYFVKPVDIDALLASIGQAGQPAD